MEVTSVNCNNCGAPLEVGPKTNFVTCRHCGSRLAVKRTGSVAYTEILEELDRKTDAIAEKVDVIIRQNELERIDREWEEERKKYLWTDQNGAARPPSVAGGVLGAVLGTVFGLMWVGTLLGVRVRGEFPEGHGPPTGFALVGVAIIIVAVVMGGYIVTKAREYQAAKARYKQRRAAVAKEAEAPASPPPPA